MKNKTIESVLIEFLSQKKFNNDYDLLAKYLSEKTQKNIVGKKILFMSRGEGYAKKWLLDILVNESLENNWIPTSDNDWIGVGWSITGNRAAFKTDKLNVFKELSSLIDLSPEELEDRYYTQRI